MRNSFRGDGPAVWEGLTAYSGKEILQAAVTPMTQVLASMQLSFAQGALMRHALMAAITACSIFASACLAGDRHDNPLQDWHDHGRRDRGDASIQVGDRPAFLISGMEDRKSTRL